MVDNIEIDDWIVPTGTDSVQQVKDIEVIDGNRIFYTHSGLAYTIDQLDLQEDDEWEDMDSPMLRSLMKNVSAN